MNGTRNESGLLKQVYENKCKNGRNKELEDGKDLEYYLALTKQHKSSFGEFEFKNTKAGHIIIDESVHEAGAKARMADFWFSTIKSDHLVYVAPRVGYAAISLSYLCNKYGKKLTLVMPSSKQVSDHQALAIQYGAKPLFVRVAAMRNANIYAEKYAKAIGAMFVPLGLDTELVYAGAIREFQKLRPALDGKRLWCVISTGVLSRSLQIALPETEIMNVAVARNIQDGELGRAGFVSYHKSFTQKSDETPDEFNSVDTYDAKGWHYLCEYGRPGDFFFNVAGEPPKPTIDVTKINSQRDWGDFSDFANSGVDFA